MSLSTTLDQIQNDLTRDGRRAGPLAEARTRRLALAPYETISSLLDALDLRSPLALCDRDDLVAALAAEAQHAPHPLWQSLLLVAFAPMLRRLRTRLGRRRDEERDQAVLFAFLESVRSVVPGSHTALALRWSTEKRVFGAVRKERRAPPMVELDEESFTGDIFEVEALEKAANSEIVRLVESLGDESLVDVFLATSAGDQSLKEYVAATYTGRTKKAFAAEYNRLCRARLRLVEDLRAHFPERAA